MSGAQVGAANAIEQARQAAWEERAEYGRGSSRARDKWAYASLVEITLITSEQYYAALRLARLIERSARGGASACSERVQGGGGGDYHGPMQATCHATQAANNAQCYVESRLTGNGVKIFRAAFAWPHESVNRISTSALGYRDWRQVVGALDDAAVLLVDYFKLIDDGRAKWNAAA